MTITFPVEEPAEAITDITAEAEAAWRAVQEEQQVRTPDEPVYRVAAGEFARVMQAVLPSVLPAPNFAARPLLEAVALSISEGQLEAVAADGFRASVATARCDGVGTAEGAFPPAICRTLAEFAAREPMGCVAITPGASWQFHVIAVDGAPRVSLVAPCIRPERDSLATLVRRAWLKPEPKTISLSPQLLRSILTSVPEQRGEWRADLQITAPDKAVLLTIRDGGVEHSRHMLMPMVVNGIVATETSNG